MIEVTDAIFVTCTCKRIKAAGLKWGWGVRGGGVRGVSIIFFESQPYTANWSAVQASRAPPTPQLLCFKPSVQAYLSLTMFNIYFDLFRN